MNYELKRILCCIIALIGLLPSTATQYLVLTQQDGTVSRFALTEAPVITFSAGSLVVTCGSQTLTTSMAGLKTSFEEDATDIQQAQSDPTARPVFAFGQASFEGLKADAPITVYTLDGKVIGSTKADADGRASIDLTGMGRGVLIVRTPTQSFKIKH